MHEREQGIGKARRAAEFALTASMAILAGIGMEIFASMFSEEAALAEERQLIELHKPEFNIAYTTHVAEPWKLTLLPENDKHDKQFYFWCDAIGTRAMAARILLKKGINVKEMISRIGPIPLEVKFV